jgi:hypothetical protein
MIGGQDQRTRVSRDTAERYERWPRTLSRTRAIARPLAVRAHDDGRSRPRVNKPDNDDAAILQAVEAAGERGLL